MITNSVKRMTDIQKYSTYAYKHEIATVIAQRNITRLCHMTQINKVVEILCGGDGILATNFIEDNDRFRNDRDRLDGKLDYISTSVQYPNVWYYRNKKYVNPLVSDWAVLLIDPEVCKDSRTLYCPVNAATGCGAFIQNGAEGFRSMFLENVYGRSRCSNLLACCPTDDQAEVLIYHSIALEWIKGIVFESERTLWKVYSILQENGLPHPALYVCNDMFDTSCSKMIRRGKKPQEILVVKESKSWQRDLCS